MGNRLGYLAGVKALPVRERVVIGDRGIAKGRDQFRCADSAVKKQNVSNVAGEWRTQPPIRPLSVSA